MKKLYKIEFIQKESFVIDVVAENEDEAKELAKNKFTDIADGGHLHYHEDRDPDVSVGSIYDVTNTDDPHEAKNTNICDVCKKPQDDDGRCSCTNKDSN